VRELSLRSKVGDSDNDPAWWIEHEPETTEALSVDLAVDAVEEITPDTSRMVPANAASEPS
jgi:competence protein ComEC